MFVTFLRWHPFRHSPYARSLLLVLNLFFYFDYSHSLTTTTMKGAVNMALSVDGFIAGKDGNIDWLNNQPQIEGEDMGFGEFMKSVDVMIMGRNTFDTVVAFGKDLWAYGDLPIVVWTRNVQNVKVDIS